MQKEREIKSTFLGESGVGKTSLISRIVKGSFNENEATTTGGCYTEYNCRNSNNKIVLWDTAGQEKYRSLAKIFMKDSKIIFFVYDITHIDSFKELNYWITQAKDVLGDFQGIILANKCDLYEREEVREEDAKRFAEDFNMKFFEVSAKENTGIERLLNYLEDYAKQGNIDFSDLPFEERVRIRLKNEEDDYLKKYEFTHRRQHVCALCPTRIAREESLALAKIDIEMQEKEKETCGCCCLCCFKACCLCCNKKNKKENPQEVPLIPA